jgi:hypothetical protein
MRRGDADLQRYVLENAGITTAAERARQIDDLIRYRHDGDERPLAYPRGMQFPPGFQAGNTTTTTSAANGQANAIYLGQAPDDIRLVTVRMLVDTPVSTTTWAELAICTSLEAPFGSPDLILEGYTNVQGTFNGAAGVRDTEITVDIARDAHAWLCWGSSAGTPFQVRGGLGDPLTTGKYAFASATRLSTQTNPTTYTATTSASVAAWVAFQW